LPRQQLRALRSSAQSSLLSSLGRRLLWSLVPAAIVLGAVWGVVFGDDGLIERHAIKQRQARVEERVTTLEAENAKLRDEIRRLREDPVAVRRAAAEQLLAAEPGSTIYRLQ